MPSRGSAILVTEFLAHSLQYRRLLMRLPAGPSAGRDRLLDAMASLLVDLHRGGVYWGDCSLANTLFRRDGDLIQAYLVDAETSETHPRAFGRPARVRPRRARRERRLRAGRPGRLQRTRRTRPATGTTRRSARRRASRSAIACCGPSCMPRRRSRPAIAMPLSRRVRRLNDLGFAVDEIEIEPSGSGGRLRFRIAVATRRFHARELERRTGLVALEGQARILMNDLREYRSWLQWFEHRRIERPEAARRWIEEVFRPTTDRLASVVGPDRDIIQAYCDVLEHKWLLSEQAGRDVGLETASSPTWRSGPRLRRPARTRPPRPASS